MASRRACRTVAVARWVASALRSGSAAAAGSGLGQRGDQRGAPDVELREVVEALVGDELGLLGGQRLEGVPGAHTTAGERTWDHASRSSPSRRATWSTRTASRSMRASMRRVLQKT